MNALPARIAGLFCPDQTVTEIAPLGNGLINSTFLVRTAATGFVLQKINGRVFPHPEQVIENLQRINRHLQSKNVARLSIPVVLKTATKSDFVIDRDGQYWRALQLIEHAESRERISRIGEAGQTGFALALFHRLLSDLDPQSLHDTLPGFHITPNYLRLYHQAVAGSAVLGNDPTLNYCRRFIERFQDRADVLEQAKEQGLLRERVIHGDPKLNNFLFAENSDTILSLIDLDTVKPGLIHYDIGDCLRSCCHDKQHNCFDLEICSALLQHYLGEAGHFFTAADYDYLYAAIELIPFELGLRFFTDFLSGNQYFKVDWPEQNLQRASEQFALCESIGQQRDPIQNLIERLRRC